MNVLEPTVKLETPETVADVFAPQLAWPSLSSCYGPIDLPHFPGRDNEASRRGVGEFGTCSPDFVKAVERAQNRVWLVDVYLLDSPKVAGRCFFTVFERAFYRTKASDIRFLTTSKSEHREQISHFYRLRDKRRAPPYHVGISIEVKQVRKGRDPVRLPHDRFAIIDSELWHWGANVGGTHDGVNAYSRGWSADQMGAAGYFERLWDGLPELKL
jgi:hypothetical protein